MPIRITVKGQVTIPKRLREVLRLSPGDYVELDVNSSGEIVVRKRGYDAFAGTFLDRALRARNVTSLVVTGTMTDICVLATVTAALHREYRVTLVEDGVATLWPEIQRATLDIIRRAYARVLSAKEVADELARG